MFYFEKLLIHPFYGDCIEFMKKKSNSRKRKRRNKSYIAELRAQLGFTQDFVAERLNVSFGRYKLFEVGRAFLDYKHISKLRGLFSVKSDKAMLYYVKAYGSSIFESKIPKERKSYRARMARK